MVGVWRVHDGDTLRCDTVESPAAPAPNTVAQQQPSTVSNYVPATSNPNYRLEDMSRGVRSAPAGRVFDIELDLILQASAFVLNE